MRVDCKIKERHDAAIAEDLASDMSHACAIIVEEVNTVYSNATWILDTGASSHMSFDHDDFISLRDVDEQKEVLFGDKSTAPVEGIGDIVIRALVDGKTRKVTLKNAFYVPQLRRKLISVSSATNRGCTGQILSNKMVISKNGQDMVVGIKQSGLYVVQLAEEDSFDFNTEVKEDSSQLWHARLGHINSNYITKTAKVTKGLDVNPAIKDARTGDIIKCDGCQVGKLAKLPVPVRTSERATVVGERVHADICGPVGQETFSGATYFVLFKDECSCFRMVYMMKSRSEAYECLRKTIAFIEAEAKTKFRCFVTDRGSEFTSNRTQELLLKEKITHKMSAPHTPAQNGFIGSDNRTLMEGVNCSVTCACPALCGVRRQTLWCICSIGQ